MAAISGTRGAGSGHSLALGAFILGFALTAAGCGDSDDDVPEGPVPTTLARPSSTISIITTTTLAPTTTAPAASTIVSPADGSVVPMETIARGTVSGIPAGSQLWTVVEIGVYYPQDGPIPVRPDGGWSGSVVIGAPADAGKTFLLHLVATGNSGSTLFGDYLRTGRATGHFPGIPRERLAPDVRFLATVTVIRS